MVVIGKEKRYFMNYCRKCGSKLEKFVYLCKKCNSFIQLKETNDELFEHIKEINKKKSQIILIFLILLFIITLILLIIEKINFFNFSIRTIIICKLVLFFADFLIIIIFSIFVNCSFFKNEGYKADYYYKQIVYNQLKERFSDIIYNPNNGICKKVIDDINILKNGIYMSEDYISGKYKEIYFELSDVCVWSGNETRNFTYFKGQWLIFNFNKEFSHNFDICKKNFVGLKSIFMRNLYNGFRFEKIEIENQDFNKEFDIFSEDELDAFRILTPHFIEKVEDLNNHISGDLLLCFRDNKLYIGINNNYDFFEYNKYLIKNLEDIYIKVFKELDSIVEFIDKLDLDNDLFRREV